MNLRSISCEKNAILFADKFSGDCCLRLFVTDNAFHFMQYDEHGKLAKALDARPLTNVVKDLEAKMKGEPSS
jgi:hypothetical protein